MMKARCCCGDAGDGGDVEMGMECELPFPFPVEVKCSVGVNQGRAFRGGNPHPANPDIF